MEKISIIIPMYNSQETIRDCIESVLCQKYLELAEIIIVDDGSVDNSANIVTNIIKKNNSDIKMIQKPNGGVSSARNTGINMAKGFWIALLDSDDVWLPNKMEVQMNILMKNSKIDFLGCSRNNEVLSFFGKKVNSLTRLTVLNLLVKMYPQTSTAIFKKKLFEKYGGYNESMTHAEDGELWVRYCANSNFYYTPESLVVTGGGKPSFGHSGLSANLKEMYKGNINILKSSYENKLINLAQFTFFKFFYRLKFFRRKIITKLRNYDF